MGSLFSIGLKLIKPLMILFLLAISHFSLMCCFSFLRKADNFNYGVVIIGIAIVLKLLLNITTFANFKVVQKYSWLTTLFTVSVIDLVIFIIPFLVFFFKETLGINRPKGDEAIRQLSANINTFVDCSFSTLNEFQYHFSGFLLLYMSIALITIFYFRKNYRKLQNEAN